MNILKLSFCCLVICSLAASCRRKEEPEPVQLKNNLPEFYNAAKDEHWGLVLPEFRMIAMNTSRIDKPQDLDFHPTRQNEVWIVNKGTEESGSTTNFIHKKDGNAWHFMSLTSALAFSENGNWASTPNVLDANHDGGRYTGPSLWSSDMSIYAEPSGGNGSHLDMVHQSPLSMGIAAEKQNIFWVFDGYYNNIIRYDFVDDHGPGNDYHSDAKLRRYTEVKVKRDPNVPSHLVLDKEKKWLYIVDGGNKRILRLDINSGYVAANLPPVDEDLAEYSRMAGANWEVFYDSGLQKPCGIDIVDNRLFISDYETGAIICIDVNSKKQMARINTGSPGITGIKVYKNRLWYVNETQNTLMVVSPR
jgi:hypothetical protein